MVGRWLYAGKVGTLAMDLGISGKVALVTGVAGGIGAAIAEDLAKEGVRIVVVDIDVEAACQQADALIAAGFDALAVGADVTVSKSVGVDVSGYGSSVLRTSLSRRLTEKASSCRPGKGVRDLYEINCPVYAGPPGAIAYRIEVGADADDMHELSFDGPTLQGAERADGDVSICGDDPTQPSLRTSTPAASSIWRMTVVMSSALELSVTARR
jgi:hypothetical protein